MTSDKGISAKTLTLILAVGEGKTLYPLTRTRPQPLVSYGGMFRIIDFTLSNCWNSGIRRAFVLTDYQHWLTERYLDSLGWNGNFDRCLSRLRHAIQRHSRRGFPEYWPPPVGQAR